MRGGLYSGRAVRRRAVAPCPQEDANAGAGLAARHHHAVSNRASEGGRDTADPYRRLRRQTRRFARASRCEGPALSTWLAARRLGRGALLVRPRGRQHRAPTPQPSLARPAYARARREPAHPLPQPPPGEPARREGEFAAAEQQQLGLHHLTQAARRQRRICYPLTWHIRLC